MYDMYFQYFDGTECLCEHIVKVSLATPEGLLDFSGDDISKCEYFRPKIFLYLYSDRKSYVVSCNNLKLLEVSKNE